MEHIKTKNSSDSKLQIKSICSIRNLNVLKVTGENAQPQLLLFIFIMRVRLYGFVTAVRSFRVIPMVAIVGCGAGRDVCFS